MLLSQKAIGTLPGNFSVLRGTILSPVFPTPCISHLPGTTSINLFQYADDSAISIFISNRSELKLALTSQISSNISHHLVQVLTPTSTLRVYFFLTRLPPPCHDMR